MMKQIPSIVLLLLILLLAACSAATETETAVSPKEEPVNPVSTDEPEEITAVDTLATLVPQIDLPDLGEAPEITNDVWINSDAPITLASQRGKVVLLEFWTFG